MNDRWNVVCAANAAAIDESWVVRLCVYVCAKFSQNYILFVRSVNIYLFCV